MRTALALAALVLPFAVAADEPPAAAVLAALPFLDSQPNQVLVDLAPPGAARPLALLVDTGAAQSVATAAEARALGIVVNRSKETPYRRATRLGRDLELMVDTRRSDTGAGVEGEHGFVGGPFLSNYVLELDFPRARLRFLDPDRYRVPEREPGAATLPVRLVASRPLIDIEIGGARVPAVIATGAQGTLIVPGGWAAEAGLRDDAEATARLALPPGSPQLKAATAARVRIGPFEDDDVPLLVAPNGLAEQGARGVALLGVDFLKRFVIRIDYPRRRVWIADGGAAAD